METDDIKLSQATFKQIAEELGRRREDFFLLMVDHQGDCYSSSKTECLSHFVGHVHEALFDMQYKSRREDD